METTQETTENHPTSAPGPFGTLTARELQVAASLAIGATCKEIADELGIGTKTVDTHRGHVLAKTGARNTVVLARMALKAGLVTLDKV